MRNSTALKVLLECVDKACQPLEFDANAFELGFDAPTMEGVYKRRKKYREAYATIYYYVTRKESNAQTKRHTG